MSRGDWRGIGDVGVAADAAADAPDAPNDAADDAAMPQVALRDAANDAANAANAPDDAANAPDATPSGSAGDITTTLLSWSLQGRYGHYTATVVTPGTTISLSVHLLHQMRRQERGVEALLHLHGVLGIAATVLPATLSLQTCCIHYGYRGRCSGNLVGTLDVNWRHWDCCNLAASSSMLPLMPRCLQISYSDASDSPAAPNPAASMPPMMPSCL